MEGDDGPRVEWKSPNMLGDIAITTCYWVSSISLRAIPRKEVLIFIQRTGEGSPVVPIFLEGVNDISFVVSPIAKFQEIFFGKATWDIEFGLHWAIYVTFLWAYETHQV
jgi:hypothetical protein